MKTKLSFAAISAGAERFWVSSKCFLEPGPNCTVIISRKQGETWHAVRIQRSSDPLFLSILKKNKGRIL